MKYEFRDLQRSDEIVFDRMIAKNDRLYADYYGSEICFDVLWQWRESERMQIAVKEDAVIVRGYDPELPAEERGQVSYIFPFAESERAFDAAVEEIVQREQSQTLLTCLSERMAERLAARYPDAVFEEWRELEDYLYRTEDLATFAGKKYHAKRNFVTRFRQNEGVEILPYSPERRGDVEELLKIWSEEKGEILPEENRAIAIALDKRERLIMDLLEISGRIEGFLIGEAFRKDALNLMFFKCNSEWTGIYPYFLNAFVNRHGAGFAYVSMQEDMGIEGLRRSKLSYHPAFLQKKYLMHFSEGDR